MKPSAFMYLKRESNFDSERDQEPRGCGAWRRAVRPFSTEARKGLYLKLGQTDLYPAVGRNPIALALYDWSALFPPGSRFGFIHAPALPCSLMT